ncbi:CidA/LrgA family protein [Ruficoccus amylovorans]|uniref:CidA/LrgA family protein n=1 Tax=Ruficoccus amylovorans TaxID=1804625 RepID=A0A842HD65_9BACT|nr:CidA/LrgA family protein [Ruficoccus amylovorans]MBC2594465.1 CidA/LrgA family protein [Ruficoccus amylovorans]
MDLGPQIKSVPLSLGRPTRQLLQTGALIGFWWLIQSLVNALHLPLPGSMVGLVLLWVMLDRGVLPLHWLEHGADGLLKHLMLFFVPAMLALVDHPEMLSLLGVKLFVTVLACTLIVMAGTACVVELGFRLCHGSVR